MRKYPSKSGPFDEALYFDQEEIDEVCESVLKSVDLYPDIPEPVRIERFLEKKFGISPEYDVLPEGVLGFTKFGPDGPERVVLSSLLAEGDSRFSERRIATTIAHEAGHILFHSDLFRQLFKKPPMKRLFLDFDAGADEKRTVLCRDIPESSENRRSSYDGSWWEHQANKAIGALLMPYGLLEKTVAPLFETKKTPNTFFEVPLLAPEKREAAVRHLSETFDVNSVVAKIRLEEIYPASKFSR